MKRVLVALVVALATLNPVPASADGKHSPHTITSNYSGVTAHKEVTDPVRGPGDWVASSVFLGTGSTWIEIGWIEMDYFADTPTIYTYSPSGGWKFHGSAPIGEMVGFRIITCSKGMCARYQLPGEAWTQVRIINATCPTIDGGAYCPDVFHTLVETEGTHPSLGSADGAISFDSVKVRKPDAMWQVWNGSVSTYNATDSIYPSTFTRNWDAGSVAKASISGSDGEG